MIRRGAWLATGVVVGAGGAVWVRRTVVSVQSRLRRGTLPAELATGVEHGLRRGAARVRAAVATGVDEARQREDDLRRRHGLAERTPA